MKLLGYLLWFVFAATATAEWGILGGIIVIAALLTGFVDGVTVMRRKEGR
jgi:hypothetical protein